MESYDVCYQTNDGVILCELKTRVHYGLKAIDFGPEAHKHHLADVVSNLGEIHVYENNPTPKRNPFYPPDENQ